MEYGGVKRQWIVVLREILRKGRFIVATKTSWDSDELSNEEALRAYKEQQYAERGFRFLKDPFFFADIMFLKNESRIVAMVMIMGLALMIHSSAERKLREAPEKKDAVSQPLPLFHPKSSEKRGTKEKESDVTCAYGICINVSTHS